jgi:peptidoglycan biosynthesis protein MviN/MurJ (putative lipid II flippase)
MSTSSNQDPLFCWHSIRLVHDYVSASVRRSVRLHALRGALLGGVAGAVLCLAGAVVYRLYARADAWTPLKAAAIVLDGDAALQPGYDPHTVAAGLAVFAVGVLSYSALLGLALMHSEPEAAPMLGMTFGLFGWGISLASLGQLPFASDLRELLPSWMWLVDFLAHGLATGIGAALAIWLHAGRGELIPQHWTWPN